MNTKGKIKLIIFLIIDVLLIAVAFVEILRPSLHFGSILLLNPHGIIALKERNLIITATALMLIVVVPVYFLIFFFAWKYKAGNTGSQYSPDLESRTGSAILLWAIPAVIIFTIAVLNWKSTHELDPYKPIASDKKPITIQVVALQWKFLFIYPEQKIATVNFIEFPEGTPLNFELTADAPMSSFWIPQLGSQIYAMPAMSTQLHLIANTTGDFKGLNTEINGQGFSGMKFIARSASQSDFDQWVKSVQQSSTPLNLDVYDKLSAPSENNTPAYYASVDQDLYNTVMMKYMMPASEGTSHSAPTPAESMTPPPMMDMGGMEMK